MRLIRVMSLSAWMNFKQSIVQPGAIGIMLMGPFFYAVTAMYMLRHRPDFDPVYLVVGVGLAGVWSSIVWVGGSIISSERSLGTLETLEASPVSLFVIFGGKMLANVALALFSAVPGYLVGAWFFGYSITVSNPGGFVVSVFLTLFAVWSMALLVAPVYLLWPPVGNLLTATEYPIYILSGFLVPVTLLPTWLHPLSFLLPPFWAASALHETSSGAPSVADTLVVWGAVLGSSFLVLLAARWLFVHMSVRARREGRLGWV